MDVYGYNFIIIYIYLYIYTVSIHMWVAIIMYDVMAISKAKYFSNEIFQEKRI